MNSSVWGVLLPIIVSVCALIYSILSNTKKYELTYQYYSDILKWHNEVVEVLVYLRLTKHTEKQRFSYLAKLSALIENGRFYFPNIQLGENIDEKKPLAYRGERVVILDFLVYAYNVFRKNDNKKYLNHVESLQKLFTSSVFEYLEPRKQKNRINRNTLIIKDKDATLDNFLKDKPENISVFFNIDLNK